MIGKDEDKKTIYVIDFGLSRSFRMKDGNHIQFREHVGLVGTTRYASVYSHLGTDPADGRAPSFRPPSGRPESRRRAQLSAVASRALSKGPTDSRFCNSSSFPSD